MDTIATPVILPNSKIWGPVDHKKKKKSLSRNPGMTHDVTNAKVAILVGLPRIYEYFENHESSTS